jgi:flavodoxin
MKVVIVYFSRYGNGKKCVDCVESALEGLSHEVQVINVAAADPAQLPQADFYVFSGPAEQFGMATPLKKFMKEMPELAGKRYALINTHGLKKPRGLPRMEKFAGAKKMVKVAEINFQVGKEANTGNGLPADYQARLSGWVNGFA